MSTRQEMALSIMQQIAGNRDFMESLRQSAYFDKAPDPDAYVNDAISRMAVERVDALLAALGDGETQ